MATLAGDINFYPALIHDDGTPKHLHELDEDTLLAPRAFTLTVKTEGTGAQRKMVGYELKARFPERLRHASRR